MSVLSWTTEGRKNVRKPDPDRADRWYHRAFDYLTAHVLTCLIPAFFIAGAMNALLNKESITRYLGAKIPLYKAYPVAVVGGLLLAVCSCTILPLFAGIKKKGAGLGPAIAFLYTAPATNILAIALTWSVIGADFAIARIVLSITFAIMIGLIISTLFKEKSPDRTARSYRMCMRSRNGGGRWAEARHPLHRDTGGAPLRWHLGSLHGK